ncbi:hypothetical protein BJV74DRAFT_849409 [Russula compacta]|nr:hypothetical protein BJV74DRAFT_849409 [Russula compacta]
MSSSPLSSPSSSSSSSFPSSAMAMAAASRVRRNRRNAFSLEAESEWDAPSPTPTAPTTLPSWRQDDELICPLSSPSPSSSSSISTTFLLCVVPASSATVKDDELQAMLAGFAFPSATRKHRRSGETIFDHSSSAAPLGASASKGCASGPVRRAQCAHCEHGRSSV